MLNRLFTVRYLRSTSRSSVVRILSMISVFGISLGVLTMIVVLSVMNGFDEEIEKRILSAHPHLVVQTSQRSDEGKIQEILPVDATVQGYSKQDVIIRTIDGVFSGGEAYGLNSDRIQTMGRKISRAAEVKEDEKGHITTNLKSTAINKEIKLGTNEIAVGYDLARSLGIFEGDEVTLIAPESLLMAGEPPLYEKAKVKALISTDVQNFDSKYIYYNFSSSFKKLKDTASMTQGFEVKLSNPHEAMKYKELLISAGQDQVQTWEDLNKALFYSLKMEKKLMGVFLGITVLISSFSIMSVLFLLVTEKQKDVATLKALGAKKTQILKIFSSVGMTLGVLGIGSGTLLGLTLCGVIKKYPIIKLPDIYYDTSFPVKVEAVVIVFIICLGAVMTMLSALWPAYKVSQTSPIQK